jgi:hypothetical protein
VTHGDGAKEPGWYTRLLAIDEGGYFLAARPTESKVAIPPRRDPVLLRDRILAERGHGISTGASLGSTALWVNT